MHNRLMFTLLLFASLAINPSCRGEDGQIVGTVALDAQHPSTRQRVMLDSVSDYQIALDYRAPADTELILTIGFEDIFGHRMKDQYQYKLNSGTPRFKAEFSPPARAATAIVNLRLPSRSAKSSAIIENITFKSIQSSKSQNADKPFTWEGEWIWSPESTTEDSITIHFRKAFDLPAGDSVDEAKVAVTADNVGTIYVNGTAVPPGSHYNDWLTPDVYDIKPYLRNGRNALCVKGKDVGVGSPAGVVLESYIRLASGKTIFLKSDHNWKCSKDAPDDWSTPDFDDQNWVAARSLGSPPASPWGNRVSYKYVGPVSDIVVESVSLPKSVQPGTEIPYSLTLSADGKPVPSANLFVELRKKNSDEGIILLKRKLDQRDLNGSVALQGRLKTSRYLPSGEYELWIGITKSNLIPGSNAQDVTAKNNYLVHSLELVPSVEPVKNPTARYKIRNGTPRLFINGKTHTTMNYYLDYTSVPGLIGNCRDNGLHIYFLNVSDIPSKAPHEYDFSKVGEMCSSLLQQDPDAYIIFILAVDSFSSGEKVLKGWTERNPDERALNSEGSPDLTPGYNNAPSMASSRWQEDSESLIRQLIRSTRKSPYGERVIGYLPASGVSFEWQQWGSVGWPADKPVFVDYSEPARQAFVAWSKKNYADISTLNASWKTDYSSFDQITIPSKADRCRTDLLTFIDPEKSRREVDFREYYSDVVASAILRFAKAIKEETNDESICGVYYGYVMHVYGPYRYQLIGHSSVHKVLNSPDIDFLISPSDYADRQIGGGSGFMGVTDSVKLHGKVWIDQADLRTHHSTLAGRTENLSDSKAAMIRHFSNALVSGCPEQIYDFSFGWTSGDPRLMQLAGKLREIEERVLNVGRDTNAANDSIAVIVDEKSTFYTAMSSGIHVDTIVRQIPSFSRMGVGFDTYVLDDLKNMPDYKCYLFLNTFRISKKQQSFMDENLKKDGKVLVFVCAPGITDEQKLLPERVAEITGISMDVLQEEMTTSIKAAKGDNPALKYVSDETVCSAVSPFGPIFIPKEGEILGWVEEKPGLVMKRMDGWTSVFSTAPCLSAALLRGIAEYAGVRVTNPSDGDITFVGDKLIAIHTLTGGHRELSVGATTGNVEELVTGDRFPVSGGKIKIDLKPRSTYLLLAP